MKSVSVLSSIILGVGLSASAFSTVVAADMKYPIHHSSQTTSVEFGSGWYLRGDISYNSSGRQKTGYDIGAVDGSVDTFEFDDGIGISAGFGYYLNNSVRLDLNLERVMSSETTSTNTVLFPGVDTSIPAYVDVAGTRSIERSQSIDTLMAGAYYDIGNFSGFTPYIGAGAGVAFVTYSEKRTDTCSPGAAVYCAVPAGGVGEEVEEVTLDAKEQRGVFAYSFSAGAAIDVAPKTKLDMSYQFLGIDDGSLFGSPADGFSGAQIHRARLGIRFDVW